MKTFAELEQAKAEGKACENCAWLTMSCYCLNPATFNSDVPLTFCCRQYTDKLPENLDETNNGNPR